MALARWTPIIADAAVVIMLATMLLLTSPFGGLFRRHLPATMAQPRIVIDKTNRVLTVYDGRRAVKKYHVTTGVVPGDKECEGDKKTPEGDFYVCYLNPQSKYTLSLGLSYPNKEDAQRGLRDGLITQAQHDAIVDAIDRGLQPDWYTRLGGEIMIHGEVDGVGAKRVGTAGCIGMDNPDIREIFAAIPLGTPVCIRP